MDLSEPWWLSGLERHTISVLLKTVLASATKMRDTICVGFRTLSEIQSIWQLEAYKLFEIHTYIVRISDVHC